MLIVTLVFLATDDKNRIGSALKRRRTLVRASPLRGDFVVPSSRHRRPSPPKTLRRLSAGRRVRSGRDDAQLALRLVGQSTPAIAFRRSGWQAPAMNTQYLTDEDGRKIAVVVPVQDFEEILEDISDLAAVAERRGEERISLAEVKRRLIADGLIPG